MIDRFGNEFNVGDKVEIIKCENYPQLVGRIADVVPTYDDFFCNKSKVRLSFSEQWQGYFSPNDIVKHNGNKKKIYKYQINFNPVELKIETKSNVGYIRVEHDTYYACLIDGEDGNHFSAYKSEIENIKVEINEQDYMEFFSISGAVEFYENDEEYKKKIEALEKKIIDKFKEIISNKLNDINNFIKQYENLTIEGNV